MGNMPEKERRDVSPQALLAQCSQKSSEIDKIQADITSLQGLYARAKDVVDAKSPILAQIDQLSAAIMAQSRLVTNDIRKMKALPASQDEMVVAQLNRVNRKMLDTVQTYQKADSDFKKQLRAQMERQYRIVKPDATDGEVREALEEPNTRIFSQAVCFLKHSQADRY